MVNLRRRRKHDEKDCRTVVRHSQRAENYKSATQRNDGKDLYSREGDVGILSILLRHADIPKYGHRIVILSDGHAHYEDFANPYVDLGEVVKVPKHGRLIDADDAIETAWMILRGLGYLREENAQLEQTVREVFATAPAIEVEEHG